MTTVMIALFVSASAQGLPASRGADCFADAPCAPVVTLAGNARRIDAILSGGEAEALRHAVHSTGAPKPLFNPAAKRPIA